MLYAYRLELWPCGEEENKNNKYPCTWTQAQVPQSAHWTLLLQPSRTHHQNTSVHSVIYCPPHTVFSDLSTAARNPTMVPEGENEHIINPAGHQLYERDPPQDIAITQNRSQFILQTPGAAAAHNNRLATEISWVCRFLVVMLQTKKNTITQN